MVNGMTSIWLIREDTGGHDGSPDVHAVCSSYAEAEARITTDYPKRKQVAPRLWRGKSGMWKVDVEIEEWTLNGDLVPFP